VTNDTERLSVLVIDDHPLFRKGVAQLLAMDPRFELVGEAASGEEGLAAARRLEPDLILLDLNMRGMNGIETLKALRAADLDARVIMLTVSDSEEDLLAALRAGAEGYLLKDMEPEELLARLREAAAGQIVLSERLTHLLAHALREEGRTPRPEQANLTEREGEILRHIAEGLSNKRIARALGITEGTVKVHVKHLLKKLNLRSRVEAAVWAVENGYKTG
jgi:two-component system nitrate/nitrite response regulator NarL